VVRYSKDELRLAWNQVADASIWSSGLKGDCLKIEKASTDSAVVTKPLK